MARGRLILFPVTIGAADLSLSLPEGNRALLCGCRTFVVEELRSARRFLKQAGYPHPIDSTTFHLLNEHTAPADTTGYLADIEKGADIGLLSEAGLPCVADPGALMVREAQRRGIEVVPLVGPSSLMLALMGSGLGGQRFAFNGYLPVDRTRRAAALRKLEERALRDHQTQLMIEAPYRNNQLLEAMADTLRGNTMVCVACDLTLDTQTIRTLCAAEWKTERLSIDLKKRNTVFLIGE